MPTYAVNLADWQKLKQDTGLRLILLPIVDPDPNHLVTCEPGLGDGLGVRFICHEHRAAATIQTIRRRLERHQLRFYQSHNGSTWKRI